jgi:hypothetical protein
MHHPLRMYKAERIGELYEQLPRAHLAETGCIAACLEEAG